MIHPTEWTQAHINEFYNWITGHPAYRTYVADEFQFAPGELERWGLRQEDAVELVKYLKWLRVLPYADQSIGRKILVFYYTEFQEIKRRLQGDARGQRLCALFPVLARMMFQGISVFPTPSAQCAAALMNCLRQYPKGAETFEVLANLISDPVDGRFLHGFNAEELTRKQVNALIKSEHMRLTDNFEDIYLTEEKYSIYRTRVMENEEFRRDWQILKKRFGEIISHDKIVLRSMEDGPGSMNRAQMSLQPRPLRFQDAFGFFCWKWFLDGMNGDEPIVAKLSFEVTPFGTTIFIPGYWSFDPKRDIKWKELIQFHRSRGIKRQGEAFEPNRRDRENKERIFLEAERLSLACGEKGRELVKRCIRMAGLATNTNPAYVYRVLREAKRKRTRAEASVSVHQQDLPLSDSSQTQAVPGQARIKAIANKAGLRGSRRNAASP